MGRYLLLLLLALAVVATVPALRQRAAGPSKVVYRRIEPLVDKVADPVRVSVAEREEHAILGKLKDLHDMGQRFPDDVGFQEWVHKYLSVSHDPWGRDYYLQTTGSSRTIGSLGPDGQPGTADDVLLEVPW